MTGIINVQDAEKSSVDQRLTIFERVAAVLDQYGEFGKWPVEQILISCEWVYTGNLIMPDLEQYMDHDERTQALTRFIEALNQFIEESRSSPGDSDA